MTLQNWMINTDEVKKFIIKSKVFLKQLIPFGSFFLTSIKSLSGSFPFFLSSLIKFLILCKLIVDFFFNKPASLAFILLIE